MAKSRVGNVANAYVPAGTEGKKMVSEYRVREVKRYIITHYSCRDGKSSSRTFMGEHSHPDSANEIAGALCAVDDGSIVSLMNNDGLDLEQSIMTSDEAKEAFRLRANPE